ncbi:MAG TPA: hypothetical protein ENK02_05145 [Planctomycetes bacterium]|nr:hypothetical protein [Planctomycetota bacterium]
MDEDGKVVEEGVLPCPACQGGKMLPGLDPSYLYRAFALVFCPTGKDEDGCEIGVIRSVPPAHVHDPVARGRAKVVVTDVRWPEDKRRFSKLFDHHIHHERDPNITPLNDGWDSQHSLPVL